MPDCEIISSCIFFRDQMANVPDMAKFQKQKYCKGDNSLCARYRVYKALGRHKVPEDLFPIQNDKADDIIKKG